MLWHADRKAAVLLDPKRVEGQVFHTQEEVTIWVSSIQQLRPRKAIHRDEDERDACKR
jgi:hypothetical protein